MNTIARLSFLLLLSLTTACDGPCDRLVGKLSTSSGADEKVANTWIDGVFEGLPASERDKVCEKILSDPGALESYEKRFKEEQSK